MNADYRRILVAVGVAALTGGITALWSAGSGGSLDILVVLLSVIGSLLGIIMLYFIARDQLSASNIDLPNVENSVRIPAPGDDFDHTLSQFDGGGQGYLPDRGRIHKRLRNLAKEVIMHRDGYSYEEAKKRIESGDWSDDPKVAAFLEDPDTTLSRSWEDRLQALVSRSRDSSDFQELVRRTVDTLAIHSQAGGSTEASSKSLIVGDQDVGRRAGKVRTTERSNTSESNTIGDASDTALTEVGTGHWRAFISIALAFVGFGLAVRQAAVVLAGAAALGLVVYARVSTPPAVPLVVDRSIDADEPAPGDAIEVTTTVRNDGDRTIPDLRIVDGVPPGLSVTEGSPRHSTALRPGESTSFSYEVTARRGTHEFDRVYTVLRDYAGATAHVHHVPVAGQADKSLTCIPELSALPIQVPLYEQTREYLGRIPAGGGEGVEFHSTREYRPGDPSTRIDWKRLARSTTDELTTVRFNEERAATVALVVDSDPGAHVAPDPDNPGAVERSIEAAGRLVGSLLRTGDRVGIAALGPTPLWFDAGTGVDHRKRLENNLATDPAFAPTAPRNGEFGPHWVKEFHRRFPTETQVILLSPLCGHRYRFLIRQLRAFGHPVTVISPDPTVDKTVGQRLVRTERRIRIEALRASGVRVVNWDLDEDAALALGRAAERWSA